MIGRIVRARQGIGLLVSCVIAASLLSLFAPAPRPTIAPSTAPATSQTACTPGLFTATTESFSAWFPCAPTRTIRTANAVPFGEIQIVTYETTVDGVSYAAAYVNYADKLPAAAFDMARTIILDGAKRSVVRGQPVQNPVYTDLKSGEQLGVEINAAGTEKRLRARVWLAKPITYQLLVLMPSTQTDQTAITRFLESFVVLPVSN